LFSFFISVHYLDKDEVGVASLELVEPNVENDADIARHCQHDDKDNDDALDGLVDEMDESWRSSSVILLCPWCSLRWFRPNPLSEVIFGVDKKKCIECISPENPPPPPFYRLVNFSPFFIFRKLICHINLLHFLSTPLVCRITFSVVFILFFHFFCSFLKTKYSICS
jgi:hypothetical protein